MTVGYALVVYNRIAARGSKQAMRKLQRQQSKQGRSSFITLTAKAIGEQWEAKPTGFESFPVR